MLIPNSDDRQNLGLSLVLAAITVFALFIWQAHNGFSLWDEGFLWYGAQRVLAGDVPVRDFMAYDPGRYYWCAALMGIMHDHGIMSLRIAITLFEIFGLTAGLFLIARASKNRDVIFLVFSGLILVTWMFPRHKLFDISISIFLIGILTALLTTPTNKQFFITGIFIGVVAIFGRNHGIYAVTGSLLAMLWLNVDKTKRGHFLVNALCWACGIIVGFAPLILMALLIPNFALAFWESIRFLFEIKATNVALAIPWPWLVQFKSLSLTGSIGGVLTGLFFVAILAFGIISLLWVFWRRYKGNPTAPVLVATALMALPYTQFSYSRADVNHLAQGIFPFLIACLFFLSNQPAKIKWPSVLVILTAGIWVLLSLQPGWQCYESQQCTTIEISKNNLTVDVPTANDIRLLRQLSDTYTPEGQSFIAAPFWPGAYAVLERKSPMWEIYALFPRSPKFEQAEIERIKAADPRFAIILDIPLDGQAELRFKNTHPLINKYIADHFTLMPELSTSNYFIFKKTIGQ